MSGAFLLVAQGSVSAFAVMPASGVAGKVTVSPTCPGPARPDISCVAPFAGAAVQLRDLNAKVVGGTTASAEGLFQIQAGPGEYELHIVVEGMYPRCEPVPVIIGKLRTTEVNIECDSGMR